MHPWGLFGCHNKSLCTAGRLLSIKADDKISNGVTTGLSKAGGLEQATAYISLLMLHSTGTMTKQQRPALSKWRLRNEMKQFTFLTL